MTTEAVLGPRGDLGGPGGTQGLDPGPRPRAKQAACNALVALLKATACGAWHAEAKAASNAGTAGPWVRKSPRMQSNTACSSAAVMVCLP